jgi:signal transduction histidine kinase
VFTGGLKGFMTQPPAITLQSLRDDRLKPLFLFIIGFLFSFYSFSQANVLAKKGVLDLRNWNWENNGIADLNGQWEFYWNALVDPAKADSSTLIQPGYIGVPAFWNSKVPRENLFQPAFGYATYRLKILCPPSIQHLELKFLTIASEYKLFVNGKQLVEIGKVGTSESATTPDFKPFTIPVETVNNELNIVIQVSNFTYRAGGLWDYIKLGTPKQIQKLLVENVGIDFFIAGAFFLIGIFYLVIFFYSTDRQAPLYFSIFCFLLAIRPLVTGEMAILYITNWSWILIKHIEFITFYLSVPILSLFSYELFPKEFPKKILQAILLITTPFILLAIFTPPNIFRYGLKPFEIIMVLTALFGLYVYSTAVKNKRPGSIYFLTGFIILFIAIINDLLYNSLIIESVNMIYGGLFILVISQAIALSRQFFRAYARLGILNDKLEVINAELNQKNIDINTANEQLNNLNAELDIFVSKTSHDLRSPLTSVAALIYIIKEEKDQTKREEYLEMQRLTLQRLNILITDILDFSRNKRSLVKTEPIQFKELLTTALQDHRFSHNSALIEQVAEVNQDGDFVSDKSRINMILYNLISNGLKYYDISKSSPYLKVFINVTYKEAEIQVIDNGPGIEPDHLGQIFTMFYQVNSTSTGTGLGLYIVNEAVEKLKGTIKIESKLGEGTSFKVIIPNLDGVSVFDN